MPTPPLNQSARERNVANMLATLRIEKLEPSESLKPALQAYVDGQKTTADLLNEVKAKYVALQRGWRLLHPWHCCSEKKAGITNQDLLDEYEADFTAICILELAQAPVEGNFNLTHLCKIHEYLFQDVYE